MMKHIPKLLLPFFQKIFFEMRNEQLTNFDDVKEDHNNIDFIDHNKNRIENQRANPMIHMCYGKRDILNENTKFIPLG